MSNVQVFSFQNHEFKAIEKDGEPWFFVKHVCDILEIQNHNHAVSNLDDDEKGVVKADTLGGRQEVSIISESGLYALILRSNKPNAKPFRKWVTSEVLPSIRKTGSYGLIKEEHQQLLTECYDHLKTILSLNAEVAELKARPKWRPLTFAERERIKELKAQGHGWTSIARTLDRSVSAIKVAGRML